MKVILTSRIKTLGNIGDVKTVADGYGRNYLIPKKLAIVYSEFNYRFFEDRRKFVEVENLINFRKAEEVRERIEKEDLVIVANAGENDKLYGSVNGTTIANLINDLIGEKYLSRSSVSTKKPIRMLGKFMVDFNLHPEVSFQRELTIVRVKEKAGEKAGEKVGEKVGEGTGESSEGIEAGKE
ncbi:MAG: 50S ribosomal protein L9 [Rickettsiales bacterium]|jgi:large subunit ribosomal protein L9|nr:50S ribosomal protein L9 [Rickettsiales bacterium]